MKILNLFREALLQFIKESEDSIKQLLSFYIDNKPQASADERVKQEQQEYEKLVKRLVIEIKSFVELMHDAIVRFYKLDVKTSMDVNQCECLTNLLTSMVLKNPVYSQVHSLFQIVHRAKHVKECMRTIAQVRKHDDIAKKLTIDEVLLGQCIYKKSLSEEERKELTPDKMCSDEEAKTLFNQAVKRIE